MTTLLSDVEIGGRAGLSLRIEGDTIAAIGRLRPVASDELIIDGEGGALIPGLHDHHIHLRSWAAALGSVWLGPPHVSDATTFAQALKSAARAAPGGWIRGVGYHESVAGPLDAAALDAIVSASPVRIEHRTGAMWFLNSPALDRIGATAASEPAVERDRHGTPTGRLARGDAWLARVAGDGPPDLAAVGRAAAARGVTAFTDADPFRDPRAVAHLAGAIESGAIAQRVVAMGQPGLELPAHPRLTLGPVKILLDDDSAADIAELGERIRTARAEDRAVAIHCVTRLQLVAALVALADAGSTSPGGDRIEHGSVIPAELIADLVRLGLTVVTQPGLLAERGDAYRADVEADDFGSLYRCRSLVDAGVPVLLSTDAPYSAPDPWAAIRAASDRRTPTGAVIGAAEAISREDALNRLTSAVQPYIGAPADLCLLPEPLDRVLARSAAPQVAATFVAGKPVYRRDAGKSS